MVLKKLQEELTVCKAESLSPALLAAPFYFIGKTDEELSLVCRTADVPARTTAREDGWRAFRVEGTLDFSLIGILAALSGILANAGISVFAVSTYNTDYVLVKQEVFEKACAALTEHGYTVV